MRMFIKQAKTTDEDVDDEDVVIHKHTHHVHHYHNPEGMDYAGVIGTKTHHPVVTEVVERMANHPATWNAYQGGRKDLINIVQMEYQELMQAMSNNSEEHVCKELTDLAAACIHALKQM